MSSPAHARFLKDAPELPSLDVVQAPSFPSSIPQARMRERRASWHLGTWRLPQGVLYAASVGAAAALSWSHWHSAYVTAIAALATSASTIVLEMVLFVMHPRAGRALFGIRGAVWMLYALSMAIVLATALLMVSTSP